MDKRSQSIDDAQGQGPVPGDQVANKFGRTNYGSYLRLWYISLRIVPLEFLAPERVKKQPFNDVSYTGLILIASPTRLYHWHAMAPV